MGEPTSPTLAGDFRWIGKHGIGRFAAEILPRLNALEVCSKIRLLHPLDPIAQTIAVRQSGCQRYFSPGYNPPIGLKIPSLFVVHDLIHLRFGSERSKMKTLYYNRIVRPAARRCPFVLTVSEFSKNEILNWAKIPQDRVVVVGNGVSAAFTAHGERHKAPRPYCLYVGSLKDHKNVPRLIEAFSRSKAAKDFDLLFTGPESSQVLGHAAACGVAHQIHFAGMIEDTEMAKIYRGAKALLFPSLYEGFGLPALEAMACGVPVVAPAAGAVREIVGDAAIFCEPSYVESITAAIDLVLSDEPKCEEIVKRGLLRARDFQWNRVAARIQDCFRTANSG